MLVAASTGQILDVVLAVFLVVVGLAVAYSFWRLGALLAQLRRTVRNTEEEVLPILNKTGGTIDRVNKELDKVDVMTDAAVDAVTALNRAIRVVSNVVTAPVQALAGIATAIRHGISSFITHHDPERAVQTAKEAAARRMTDLQEELDEAGGNRPASR